MNENRFDDILKAMMTSALRRELTEEVMSAPSDEELEKMFPETKKDEARLKKYQRLEKRRVRAEKEQPRALVYLKRAAVIALAVFSISAALFLTDTDVRAAVISTFRKLIKSPAVTYYDKYAKINLTKLDEPASDGSDGADVYDFVIGYIPEGFELTESKEEPESRMYNYLDDEKKLISIIINYTENTESDVDTESSGFEEVKIGDLTGYLSYNSNENAGSLVYGSKTVTISIYADLDKSELIRVAESIRYDPPEQVGKTDVYDFVIGYIPSGYEQIEVIEEPGVRLYSYHDPEKDIYLDVSIANSEQHESDVDTDFSEISVITINGYSGFLIYSEEYGIGTVIFGDNDITIDVGGSISKDELIKIAENIKPKIVN